MMSAVELPIPRDWQVFEDFCRDLFAQSGMISHTLKHGRRHETRGEVRPLSSALLHQWTAAEFDQCVLALGAGLALGRFAANVF